MSKISATMVADSKSPYNTRLSSLVLVLPRFILAELNTHRMLSKNSASSRAIPFKKMLKMVLADPFIPIAFQKEHKGMQGTTYHSSTKTHSISEALEYIVPKLTEGEEDQEYIKALQLAFSRMHVVFGSDFKTLAEWWLVCRDMCVMAAILMTGFNVSKQLANRLLEPFMWHTVLISGTEWENFFKLRCPQYQHQGSKIFRSLKDLVKDAFNSGASRDWVDGLENMSTIERLQHNKGQAEIHMMALAEAIWDAMNESTPVELKAGEWHIPFGDKINLQVPYPDLKVPESEIKKDVIEKTIKISTGMAARASYTTVGDEKEVSYETLIGIHGKMAVADPFHASPFEHCSKIPTEDEYDSAIKGKVSWLELDGQDYWGATTDETSKGWFYNFRGFIQYRYLLENQ